MFLGPGMKIMAVPLFLSVMFWILFALSVENNAEGIQTLFNMCVAQAIITLILTLAIIKDDLRIDDSKFDRPNVFLFLLAVGYGPIFLLLCLFVFGFYFDTPEEKYGYNYFGQLSILMVFFLDFVIATKKMSGMLSRRLNRRD